MNNPPPPRAAEPRPRGNVIGVPIDAISWANCLELLLAWAQVRESRYVCICNVHSVVTATHDATFHQVISDSDLATPDGFPVAWTLRRKGFQNQPRINGPDLMWKLCAEAEQRGIRIGLYGSTPATLDLLSAAIRKAFPALQIAYSLSPPFRKLSVEEDQAICDSANASRVGLLFVGLGCPKQEHWIAEHRGRIHAVMLGVGAAFDYHAGTVERAPNWMRTSGLEWLHRLASEPRRLWRRYFGTNSVFIVKTVSEYLSGEFHTVQPTVKTKE